MELSEEGTTTSKNEDTASLESLQAQLADYRAQVEHWQGVATICELSKQEELAELQKKCDLEMQSIQEALRETAEQYEAQICALQSESADWRRGSGQAQAGGRKGRKEAAEAAAAGVHEEEAPASQASASPPPDLEARPPGHLAESEAGAGLTEGYFSQHCDKASLSSFSCLDTPSLSRRPAPQEDTASLVSTGTLVPEAIYLPPAGHRLVTHGDWDALNAQVSELQGEVSRLEAEREELEKELDTQTNHTHKQVALLQTQVQSSEALLQEVQKSFSQSQNAVQSRLAELSLSQRKVCSELSKLKGEEVEDEVMDGTMFPTTLQGAHCEERLRIEIVNLKDKMDCRAEENEVLEVQLSSLKTETERVQSHRDKLEAELLSCRTELQALRVALSHLQSENKALSNDKVGLQRQCLELRSQGISLRSQVETSHTVQRDFVQLSQSLQVKLEQIRQAESLHHVKQILGEGPSEESSPPNDAT